MPAVLPVCCGDNVTQTDTLLQITQEECAEVVQAIAKIFRFGLDGEYNGQTNLARLEQELGDLQCMIDLLSERGVVNYDNVLAGGRRKRAKLAQWSNIFNT